MSLGGILPTVWLARGIVMFCMAESTFLDHAKAGGGRRTQQSDDHRRDGCQMTKSSDNPAEQS